MVRCLDLISDFLGIICTVIIVNFLLNEIIYHTKLSTFPVVTFFSLCQVFVNKE